MALTLKEAFELGSEKAGSDRALSAAMGVTYNDVHMWRTGKKPISPEAAALLADVLQLGGEEARALVAQAICENPKNAQKAQRLRRALFACGVLGVVASPGAIDVGQPVDHLYIVAAFVLARLGMAFHGDGLPASRPNSCARACVRVLSASSLPAVTREA